MPGHGHGRTKGKGKPQKVTLGDTEKHVRDDSGRAASPVYFGKCSTAPGQSRTWRSVEATEKAQFTRSLNLVRYLAPKSDALPKTYRQWVQHRTAVADMEKETMEEHLKVKEARQSRDARVEIKSAFGPGATMYTDNRSTVLSLPTIWAPWSTPTPEHPEAPWPTLQEMQFEAKNMANFGRFLPLPRKPKTTPGAEEESNILIPFTGLDDVSRKVKRDERDLCIWEVMQANKELDGRKDFASKGTVWLGQAGLVEKL
jgi:hypothetical protein